MAQIYYFSHGQDLSPFDETIQKLQHASIIKKELSTISNYFEMNIEYDWSSYNLYVENDDLQKVIDMVVKNDWYKDISFTASDGDENEILEKAKEQYPKLQVDEWYEGKVY